MMRQTESPQRDSCRAIQAGEEALAAAGSLHIDFDQQQQQRQVGALEQGADQLLTDHSNWNDDVVTIGLGIGMKESLEQGTKMFDTFGREPSARFIIVSIGCEQMGFHQNGQLVKSYVISTSLRPPSNGKNSLGTPRGLHEIAECIGAGAPPGIVFKSRVNSGLHFSEIAADEQAGNLITTRILWLRGLEPGVNSGLNASGESVDTYERYVYIHGTNHEERLGSPASSGCVQMRNLDIIELFDAVRVGDLVWIQD